jgi:hypothetical protein
MDDSLVKEIVARILADPRFQAMLTAPSQKEAATKPVALVVADSEAAVALLPDLQERWGASCALQVCLSGPVQAAKTALPQRSCPEALQDRGWSRLLVPVCSSGQLAEIALGLCGTSLSALVGEAILRGIPVEIGQVDYGFTDRTPAAYRQLFESHAKTVAAYGVTIGATMAPSAPAQPSAALPPVAAASTLPGMVVAKEAVCRPEVPYDKKLMTEKEAVLLPEQALLQLKRSTILTPSAIDALKQLKVQVYREGVRFL